jgi:hypothetical protein
MVIVLLSALAASVILLQSLRRKAALFEVARTKADYAAQSGIACLEGIMKTPADSGDWLEVSEYEFIYPDSSAARVRTEPWGLWVLAHSEGRSGPVVETRSALLGAIPRVEYGNALIYGNDSHQLVLTDSAFIRGDVFIGSPGLTTGTLPQRSTPLRLPCTGRVHGGGASVFLDLRPRNLGQLLGSYRRILLGVTPRTCPRGGRVVTTQTAEAELVISAIPDTVDCVRSEGDIAVSGSLFRPSPPLYIICTGSVTIKKHTHMVGLVAVIAQQSVSVPDSCALDRIILFSETDIKLGKKAKLSGQLFSPRIELDTGAVAEYPSILLSYQDSSRSRAFQRVTVRSGAKCEGLAALLCGTTAFSPENEILILEHGANLAGLLYSEGHTTLDGAVVGSVAAREFYFYLPPTLYYGWLRSALIDRAELPRVFLLPPSFSVGERLEVLAWL